jgi:hypothetical protein
VRLGAAGAAQLLKGEDKVLRALNATSRASVRYPVIVLRDEDKAAPRSGVEQGRMCAGGPQPRTAGQAGAGARDPGNVSGRAADAVDALVAASLAGMGAQGARSQDPSAKTRQALLDYALWQDRAPMSKGSPKRISHRRWR